MRTAESWCHAEVVAWESVLVSRRIGRGDMGLTTIRDSGEVTCTSTRLCTSLLSKEPLVASLLLVGFLGSNRSQFGGLLEDAGRRS